MTNSFNPFSPISIFPSIGPAYAKRLERLEIYSIRDLLYHFPQRYVDYSETKTISKLILNDFLTVSGNIKEIKNIYTWRF